MIYDDLVILLGFLAAFGLLLAAADVPPAAAAWWRRNPPVVRDLRRIFASSGRVAPGAIRPDRPGLPADTGARAPAPGRSGRTSACRSSAPWAAGLGAGTDPAAPTVSGSHGSRPVRPAGGWR